MRSRYICIQLCLLLTSVFPVVGLLIEYINHQSSNTINGLRYNIVIFGGVDGYLRKICKYAVGISLIVIS